MGDVPTAPPSAPAAPSAAPATPAHEVPITPNPVSPPNPVGSQAPSVPPGEHRPPSRREAIQAAFDRAANPQPKTPKPAERAAQPAAEAKPGHNKSPEPTEERLDLKKRPSDQPRGDRGQFAPRQAEQTAKPPGVPAAAPPEQKPNEPIKQLPEGTPYRDPPTRMAEHAKREWAAAPESIRGEVHRMQQEFVKAYDYYKGAHEAFTPIARFHQMAQQHGTTLERALTNYTSIEQKLRSDVVGGLDVIVNNLGLKTPDGQKIGLRDIAYHVLSQSPEQLRQVQQGNVQTAAGQQIGALHQEIAGLKQAVQQMHTQQQFTTTRSAVDVFADSHPRFDELGDVIEQELKSGYDLDTAYRRAELLRPGTPAAQTGTPSAQTRPIDRSISGAPDVAPSNGASRRTPKEPSRSVREAAANAMRRYNGG